MSVGSGILVLVIVGGFVVVADDGAVSTPFSSSEELQDMSKKRIVIMISKE